jgi:hypothetical protein
LRPRIIVIRLLEISTFCDASWPIAFFLKVALVFVNRLATWRVVVRRPLIDDWRGTDLSFAHKAIGIPSLRWGVSVGKIALRGSRVGTVSRHVLGKVDRYRFERDPSVDRGGLML